MRILMITDFYHPFLGGVETHVRNLSVGLVKRGHDVAIATLGSDELPAFEIDHGVRVYRIRGIAQRIGQLFSHPGRPWAPPLPDPGLVRALWRVVEREQPDIVHGHDWLARSYLPLRPLRPARFVVSLHYYTVACAKKSLMRNGSCCNGPELSKCVRCAVDHYGSVKGLPTVLGTWTMGALERRSVDLFLAVSQATADGNGLNADRDRYLVIPNFLSSDLHAQPRDIAPYTEQLPEEPFLLFVGDLRTDKGLHVLLEAYAGLVNVPPLVLIGKVWSETPTKFPPNVIVLRDWPNYAVLEAWRRSSIALVPSIWPEPFGIVVIEAMVSGRPVIASHVGGIPDIVVDGETGILVPPGDPIALRTAIERLVRDEALRERMGEAARKRAHQFQSDAVLPKIERVYEDLVAKLDRTDGHLVAETRKSNA